MSFFDIHDYDGALFVEKTDDGVQIVNSHFTLDGYKAMRNGLHVYTIDFISQLVGFGPDYQRFKDEMS